MTHPPRVYPRRRRLGAFAPFLGAVVEILVFVMVANVIGFGYALLLLLGTSVLGLWLMRRAGFRAWRSMRATMAEAAGAARQSPRDATGVVHEESRPEDRIADAGVTLLAGTVLVLPGFVTDAAALVLLVPWVRKKVGRRLAAAALRTFPASRTTTGDGTVIEGEVVNEYGDYRPNRYSELRDPGEPDGG